MIIVVGRGTEPVAPHGGPGRWLYEPSMALGLEDYDRDQEDPCKDVSVFVIHLCASELFSCWEALSCHDHSDFLK